MERARYLVNGTESRQSKSFWVLFQATTRLMQDDPVLHSFRDLIK